MKLFLIALGISIGIHFLTFYQVKVDKPRQVQQTDKQTVQKGSKVKFVKLTQKKEPIKKPIKKKDPKLKNYKKVVKKIKPVPKRAVKKMPKPIQKAKAEVEPFNLNDFLNAANPNDEKEENLDDLTKSYIQLYGEEFSQFSDKTKKFLKNSLKSIGQITQRYLEYPYLAAYGGQSGRNVIQFFLHPDGSISDAKIIDSSGYNILDWNTLDTIEKAYQDYPRPNEKTKVIIYVHYKLY